MIGRTLSHYRLVAPLGSGGMGEVWRAEDTLLGRPVALKFPHRHLLAEPAARERFLREARAASALDHPNIVVLYEVGSVEGEVFLAMQCVEGSTLRQRMAAGPLAPAEAIRIGQAIADALAHAHSRGLVHRDVKPENVLLTAEGRVKVADFGTARVMDDTLTAGQLMVGTPAFLPPEVVSGRVADERGDLYSLGVLLYEQLTGALPFSGPELAGLLYKIVNEPPPPLPSFLPAPLRQLVESLLAKDPERRPPSAVALSDALQRIADGVSSFTGVSRAASLPVRSIAVLDFQSLSGDPQDQYFCAGITQDLLTELLKVPDLKVASRRAVESLDGRTLDIREAGEALGVATILEGGVRRIGNRVRVTAQLVSTGTGFQMWADRYDRDLADLFEVQEDISRRVANALRIVLEPDDEPSRLGRRTLSARAYDLRLRALELSRRFQDQGMREAIALLEQATTEDPGYALAHAELGECLVQMHCKGWDQSPERLDAAESRIARALALAPSLPEGYGFRAHLLNHRRQLALALRDAHRALELDPRHVQALLILANNYTYLGDAARAEVYARRSIELDPSHPIANVNLAIALRRQGRDEDAADQARRTLVHAGTPHFRGQAYEVLTLSLAGRSDFGAVEQVAADLAREPDSSPISIQRALAAALLGRADDARAWLARVGTDDVSNLEVFSSARVHMILGDRERALRTLEDSSALDRIDLSELQTDPWLSNLAGEPGYQKLFAAQS